jgi:endonuclease III-like uncharacterized protein
MNQTLASPACADLNDESVDIVGDDRERASGVIDSLRCIANVSVRIERLEGVMRAGRDDLLTVEGVGAKTADSIRWAINEKIESYGDKTFFSIWSRGGAASQVTTFMASSLDIPRTKSKNAG